MVETALLKFERLVVFLRYNWAMTLRDFLEILGMAIMGGFGAVGIFEILRRLEKPKVRQ